jgi:hypothetical protein
MPIDEQKLVNAVVMQALQHIFYQGRERAGTQRQCAGKSKMVF